MDYSDKWITAVIGTLIVTVIGILIVTVIGILIVTVAEILSVTVVWIYRNIRHEPVKRKCITYISRFIHNQNISFKTHEQVRVNDCKQIVVVIECVVFYSVEETK